MPELFHPEERPKFRTVRVEANGFVDGNAIAEAIRSSSTNRLNRPRGPKNILSFGSDAAATSRYTWRVWWQPPWNWKDELSFESGVTDVALVRRDASIMYAAARRTLYTTEAGLAGLQTQASSWRSGFMEMPSVSTRLSVFPLLTPPLRAADWQITTVGHEGAATRRVRASLNPELCEAGGSTGYWPGIQEYECLIDDQFQCLLEFTGLYGGAPAASLSMTRLVWNEEFPDDTFSFIAPAGSHTVEVKESSR